MEAASVPLHPTSVRVTGDVLRVDGLVVADACAVGLASESPDPAAMVVEAIEIGARVLRREGVELDTEFVKRHFEEAARELDAAFVQRAAKVAEKLDQRVTAAFDAEDGELAKVLAKHFDGESASAVQHQVREMLRGSREELVRQFSAGDASNPLADFKNMAAAQMHRAAQQQAEHLRAMTERMEALQREVAGLRAEREKLEAVAEEAERGTAKGRSYEEEVAAALDALADAQGDVAEACGDRSAGGGGGGKKGDVLVAVDACGGPARGRIVFEVKNKRMSRPEALRELDGAMADREADYAVLVVPSEDKVPARMQALREVNGDKLIVTFDPAADGEAPLALKVAYGLARARVLMQRSSAGSVDGAAVATAVEKALAAFEDVRRVKQQLTGAKSKIDEAASIVDGLALAVKAQLAEIDDLVRAAEAAEDEEAPPAPAGAVGGFAQRPTAPGTAAAPAPFPRPRGAILDDDPFADAPADSLFG
jgi:hypothetical protein